MDAMSLLDGHPHAPTSELLEQLRKEVAQTEDHYKDLLKEQYRLREVSDKIDDKVQGQEEDNQAMIKHLTREIKETQTSLHHVSAEVKTMRLEVANIRDIEIPEQKRLHAANIASTKKTDKEMAALKNESKEEAQYLKSQRNMIFKQMEIAKRTKKSRERKILREKNKHFLPKENDEDKELAKLQEEAEKWTICNGVVRKIINQSWEIINERTNVKDPLQSFTINSGPTESMEYYQSYLNHAHAPLMRDEDTVVLGGSKKNVPSPRMKRDAHGVPIREFIPYAPTPPQTAPASVERDRILLQEDRSFTPSTSRDRHCAFSTDVAQTMDQINSMVGSHAVYAKYPIPPAMGAHGDYVPRPLGSLTKRVQTAPTGVRGRNGVRRMWRDARARDKLQIAVRAGPGSQTKLVIDPKRSMKWGPPKVLSKRQHQALENEVASQMKPSRFSFVDPEPRPQTARPPPKSEGLISAARRHRYMFSNRLYAM